MKSPELVELCQALLKILRAAVAANQDQEVAPGADEAPAAAPQVQRTPLKSTEAHEPGAGGTP